MSKPSSLLRRVLLPCATALIAVVAVTAVAVAAGGATSSKAGKVKVKCPARVLAGQKKVTCRLFGHLRSGPQGAQGAKGKKGDKGPKGEKGDKGAAGASGVSGYEVVNQTFKEVFIENSGGLRGLSEVKTVSCPSRQASNQRRHRPRHQRDPERPAAPGNSLTQRPQRHRHRLVSPALQQLDLNRHLDRLEDLRDLRQRELTADAPPAGGAVGGCPRGRFSDWKGRWALP